MDTLARTVIEQAQREGVSLATVESCTGGLLGGALTSVPGSSDVYKGGFITYANEAKVALVGVSEATLNAHGAVSEETAKEMARGCREHLNVDIAVSVTGIAGPAGGTPEKPVGTVWFGVATPWGAKAQLRCFDDNGREEIRKNAVRFGLDLFKTALCDEAH